MSKAISFEESTNIERIILFTRTSTHIYFFLSKMVTLPPIHYIISSHSVTEYELTAFKDIEAIWAVGGPP